MTQDTFFKTMLTMQDDINQRINQDWKSLNHAWYRAIWIECAELMDHYGWKWWKKQTPDNEQIQLELVDIWHFGLSDCLQRSSEQKTMSNSEHTETISELNDAINKPYEYPNLLTGIEDFTERTLKDRRFSAKHFFGLTKLAKLDLETLYRLYISKNVLNFFRQDHGYQSGSYQKIWSGKEDNVHLSEIVSEGQHKVAAHKWREHLYAQLKARYETPDQKQFTESP